MLARVRALIREADPGIIEERKWKKPSNPDGVPVWSHDGIVCTGETYTKAVKLTFAGDDLDVRAFKALVKAAVARNQQPSRARGSSSQKAGARARPGRSSRP